MKPSWLRSLQRSLAPARRPIRRTSARTRLAMTPLESRVTPATSIFQQGVNSGAGLYAGTQDVTLQQANPTTSDPNGELQTVASAGAVRQFLIRFDDIIGTGPGQIPPGAFIVSATLTFDTTAAGDGGTFNRMLQTWDETATWSTFGGDGIQADGTEANATFAAHIGATGRNSDPGTGTTPVGVTDDVQAWVNGAANNGWAVLPWGSSTALWSTNSSEAVGPTDHPVLTVNWLPPGGTVTTFQEGVNGYAGTADTLLAQGSPDVNNGNQGAGSNTVVSFVDADDGGANEGHVLLRFDNIFGTGPGQVPVGSTILGAALQVRSNASNARGDGGRMFRMLQTWDENTITWNSAVAGISPNGVEAATTFESFIGSPTREPDVEAGYNSFDVSADIQAWFSGEANNGWAILPWPSGTDGWGLNPSESADPNTRPRLTIYYEAPPPGPTGPNNTLDIVGGALTFTGGQNVANGLTLSVSGPNYVFSDTSPIVLGPGATAAGWTAAGNTATGPTASATSLAVNLNDGVDTFNLQGTAAPISVHGGGTAGDTANITGNVTVTGTVEMVAFSAITQSAGTTLTATTVDLSAGTVGTAANNIRTTATTVRAIATTGGAFVTETDGADFTAQAGGAGNVELTTLDGTLTIAGATASSSGNIVLTSPDGVTVNADVGDLGTTGTITITANTDGAGAEGYLQGAAARLITTNATGNAIGITVNTAGGGTGDAVLGAGLTGSAGRVLVNSNGGSILWNPALAIPAINTSNGTILASGGHTFTTTGAASSVGTEASPLQIAVLDATQITTATGGTGGVYLTDWQGSPSQFAATATGAGDVQIIAANAGNNGIIVAAPITTGSGDIILRADDSLIINQLVGGPTFSGTVLLQANMDGGNGQVVQFNVDPFLGFNGSVQTTNATANAVVIRNSPATNATEIGGVVLGDVTVGSGGTITVDTMHLLGTANDANRAGIIIRLPNTSLNAGPTGTVILNAGGNAIGTSTDPIRVTAGTVTATTTSTTSTTNPAQAEGSVFVVSTGPATFTASTTTADTRVGVIDLKTEAGVLTVGGLTKTDTGSLTLTGAGGVVLGADVGTLVGPTATTGPINIVATTGTISQTAGAVNTSGGLTLTGAVAPGGAGATNLFNANANTTFATGSSFNVDLAGAAAGTGYDQLKVTGTVTLNNATLNAAFGTGFTPSAGQVFTIVDNDGTADPVVGTFNGLAQGATVTVNGVNLTLSYTGGDGNNVTLTAPGTPTNPPTVGTVVVNGGGAQRSEVRSVVVTFSEVVNFAGGNANAAAAFTLSRIGGGGNVGLAASVATVGTQTVVTLTFTTANPAVVDAVSATGGASPSLADGRYQLAIADGAVTSQTTGLALDGDANGSAGGAYQTPPDTAGSGAGFVFGLYRLFGDATGNGLVDLADLAEFRSTFNQTAPNPAYLAYLDADNSNTVDLADLSEFRSRFNQSLFTP